MLSVRGLGVARGGLQVLSGLTFDLAAGEVLVLRGPNGCGKTTLLRTLAGLQPQIAGEMVMALDSLAYASHADGLKPTLTVMENLQFWASVFGTGMAEIAAAMQVMDLEALAARASQNLSAGQKRRLGLARLLLSGRKIWALDEPTVSLDQASVARFADMVRSHLASGGAAIIATHIDLGLAGSRELDLTAFRPHKPTAVGSASDFDEAFL